MKTDWADAKREVINPHPVTTFVVSTDSISIVKSFRSPSVDCGSTQFKSQLGSLSFTPKMSSSSESRAITVIGAGVIGLTTALLLSKDARNKVLVIAEFMPGDYDIGYASPWAGANFFPTAEQGTLQAQLEQETWKVLKHLASSVPEACVHFQEAVVYTREEDVGLAGPLFVGPGKEPWWKEVCRVVRSEELPPGIAAATKFKTACINPALYLPYLVSECRRRGVIFRRQKVGNISDAQEVCHPNGKITDILVNATGLGSKTLKGVEDSTLFPVRGQAVLVENDPGYMMAVTSGRDGKRLGYCMTRAAGGGTILGGCFQTDNVESTADFNLASQFMKTVVDLCPSIVKPGQGIEGLKIIRHGVGLRPMRRDGPRIELDDQNKTIIHCYGHGSYGYQTSWASAERVVKLVRETEQAQQPTLKSPQ
ncbi:uncharacterized protein N7498_005868 [Penicillium cinerascens]|uniref:FAD dependent oxidoreductase domain-containing protein n=1 Tax=Penicillium cinerascens TaxID=70096 RepID=A0A9W9MP94_9EURO|nr:uncharacterized protein N7498_005868 [Penicillium cinerascens]KAJ5204989.1 hypothetical protein N7498_005868 [Penicillium cinerascens]